MNSMVPGRNSRRFLILTFVFLFLPLLAAASTTNGTIDSTYKYSWGVNIGWLNWGTTGGNVHVTDAALTGYVWSENYGWINLAPATAGVTNNGQGILGGAAWGENFGWLYFSGVTINSSGVFQGTANGTVGDISLDCANCKVVTDWRPQSARGGGGGGGGSTGGGGTGYYAPPFPPTTLPPEILSKCDFNADGVCGLADLSIMLYYYGQSGQGVARYDLDQDKVVDFPDISILMYYWDE